LKSIISNVLKLLSLHERSRMYRLIIFDVVISLLDIAFLALLLWIINFYTGNKTGGQGLALLHPALANPILAIGGFFILFSIKNWLGYRILKFQHHFFYDVATRLSEKNMLYYLRNDYLQFVNVDSSVRIRQISQQPVEFSHYILTNLQQIATQSLLILFTALAIIFYHPALFLLLLLFLVPPVIFLGKRIRKRSKKLRMETQVSSQKAIQYLQESLSGYMESNIYDKSAFFTGRYHQYQQALNNNLASQQTLLSLPTRLVEIFAVLGVFILAIINKYNTGVAAPDLFTIGVFLAAAYKIIPGMIKILNSSGQIKTYQPVLNDLLSFEDSVPTADKTTKPIENINFYRVAFKYGQEPVLNNVSFYLKSGDMAGLWGQSGSGKSTLIQLLTGFLSAQKGSISFNNVTNTQQFYRNRISYVKQQPYFIHDTLLKNITLDDGGYHPHKIDDVIDFCGLDSLLQTYPDGLETLITENGKNLSGGQRQRVMLARALYHDFDLLILDEPFSEMDKASEKCILKKLQQLAAQGKIIILITHNQASLAYCNQIINLND
jgi:ABC-type multidrug transport system fused ATPase/permease subunit